MISSSGIIKRSLAVSAISALAVAGIPALAGTAHAAVGVTVANPFAAYDFDEFGDATPDFVVTVKDGNTLINNQAVEFSYVFTPEGGQPQAATAYAAGGTTDATGTVDLAFDPAAAGTYTVTVRTVGSHISAPAFTFVAGEGEITWADGVSVVSAPNTSDTYAGTLTLDNAAATPLSGRTVAIHWDSAGNVIMSTPQPGRVDDDNVNATTGADGGFSVGLTDPALPAGTDSGTLTADTTFTPAKDLAVSFEPIPPVTHIEVTESDVTDGGAFSGPRAPGKPVELNVVVRGQAVADATPENDPILKDYPVAFAVDKGFLTPDTQGQGLNVDPDELDLTADQDDTGDLFGFYENLGTTETVDTSDSGNDAAGIVATIEKDPGFNDDGRVAQTITVTAGTKTDTVTVDYDVRNYLNMVGAAFVRDGGSAAVPGAIDLKLYAADQYGNLIGDQQASISDDTPQARVTEENNGADTDFVNDNPTATASSSQVVRQTVTAAISAHETLVAANGDPDENAKPVSAAHVIQWRKGGRAAIIAKLRGADNGAKADKLTVVAPKRANGAVVKLFKIVGGTQVPAGTKTLKNGRASFTKADKNGNGFTKYVAVVKRTSDTKKDRTNVRKVR